jgi:exodeoxyribonuclease VIII
MKIGIFDLPAPDYFAAHGVSQSQLKLLAKSPAHLKHAIEHPPENTPDQVVGTIAHTALFEPAKLESSRHVKPASYQDSKGDWRKWNGNASACKDWLAARTDRPIISQDAETKILAMRDAVLRHPAAAMALREGKAEQALFAEDPDTGLQLKCRTDWLSGNSIVDYKTCVDSSPAGFAKSVANFGYDIQAAFNLDIAALLNLGKEHFIFIAVEKEPPFAVGVYEIDLDSIEVGRSKYRRLLNRYLECVVSDKWPAYSQNIEMLSLPAWAKKSEWNALLLEDSPQMPALEVA